MSIASLMADDLGYERGYVDDLAARAEGLYRRIKIAGRRIDAPCPELKLVQTWIADFVLAEGESLPAHVSAYEPGRSVVANARAHAGHAHLLTLDIRGFFRACTEEMVAEVFGRMSYADRVPRHGRPPSKPQPAKLQPSAAPHPAAPHPAEPQPPRRVPLDADDVRLLTTLACRRGALVMGSPSSPFIANRIMLPTDEKIMRALPAGCTYTRYSDDISISSDDWLDRDAIVSRVGQILAEAGFELHEGKTHCTGRGDARHVTGVFLTPEGGLALGPRRKRQLRRDLYRLLMGGEGDPYALLGQLGFCRQVEPAFYDRLMEKYASYGLALEHGGVMGALRALATRRLAR